LSRGIPVVYDNDWVCGGIVTVVGDVFHVHHLLMSGFGIFTTFNGGRFVVLLTWARLVGGHGCGTLWAAEELRRVVEGTHGSGPMLGRYDVGVGIFTGTADA
jgi:hypothetical protein